MKFYWNSEALRRPCLSSDPLYVRSEKMIFFWSEGFAPKKKSAMLENIFAQVFWNYLNVCLCVTKNLNVKRFRKKYNSKENVAISMSNIEDRKLWGGLVCQMILSAEPFHWWGFALNDDFSGAKVSHQTFFKKEDSAMLENI